MNIIETSPPFVRRFTIEVTGDELADILVALKRAENPHCGVELPYSRWVVLRRTIEAIA